MPLAARASREKGSEGRTKLTGNLLQAATEQLFASANGRRAFYRDVWGRERTKTPSIAGRLAGPFRAFDSAKRRLHASKLALGAGRCRRRIPLGHRCRRA